MIDVFQVANAMALTSTCLKRKEGGVVVSKDGQRVVTVCRSYCPVNSKGCRHEDVRQCPVYVSALGDLVVQGTEKLRDTQVYVVSEKYPRDRYDSELAKLMQQLGVQYSCDARIGATGSKSSKCVCHKSTNSDTVRTDVESVCSHDAEVDNRKRPYNQSGHTYGTRECKRCGKSFVATYPRQLYCNQWKIGVCPVCKKVFQYRCNGEQPPVTCGDKKCVSEVRSRNLVSRKNREK